MTRGATAGVVVTYVVIQSSKLLFQSDYAINTTVSSSIQVLVSVHPHQHLVMPVFWGGRGTDSSHSCVYV